MITATLGVADETNEKGKRDDGKPSNNVMDKQKNNKYMYSQDYTSQYNIVKI